ncbi:MAG: ATP-binding protein [Treponema sp.]|nr:ATP-binding protein [Treponema sp.]
MKNKKFFVFTLIPFIILLIIGSLGFFFSMRQMVRENKRLELSQLVETQRFNLEAQVNNEINIVLEMANSQLVASYFENPTNEELQQLAHRELNWLGGMLRTGLPFWVNDIDLIFYMGGQAAYILDPYDPASPWYFRTMRETEIFNFNINYNPDLQQTNFWINAPVRNAQNIPVGILGTGVNLTEFVNSIFRAHRGTVRLYFFNRLGEITGAREIGLVENRVTLQEILPFTGEKILQWIDEAEYDDVRIWRGSEGEIVVRYMPVIDWYIVAVEGLTLIDYLHTNMTYLFLGILGVFIIFFIILQLGKNAYDIINETRKELSIERDIIETMKDNLHQGIFLMDKDLNILPQYSLPLGSILSYYESDLTGKNFLDILSSSLDAKQLQFMKGYFSMLYTKEKSKKVLEAVNPISEFEYKTDNEAKTLSTKFSLIEQKSTVPVIIGIIQDITREKEFEIELGAQKEAQEQEMKNMFDVIKIDPLVFQNFIEDTEANFNSINSLLKDRSLTGKQVVIKIFQYIHAIKSNAVILELESIANKLHALEDDVKIISNKDNIIESDILSLAIKIETFMQELDSYIAITKKINAYKTSLQIDTIFINTMSKAVEKLSNEAQKKAVIKAGQIDLNILESKLRKPIKDILNQCVRNSLYHGIESEEERIRKNKYPQGLLSYNIRNVDGKAEVIFSDDGTGLDWQKIKKKYLEKYPNSKTVDKKILLSSIFAPEFSTADEIGISAGRGVGLSLVKELVKENNGTIKVNSTEGGLTFKFTFPLV